MGFKMPDENKTNDVSANGGGFDIGAAFFGAAEEKPQPKGDEDGGETPLGDATPEDELPPDDGDEITGDPEPGESVEVWEFNGAEYTADQVSDALKHRETFERFNTSITPLVENIKQFGETAERLQIMAVTECEKQIEEIKKQLPKLQGRDYQLAHQALQQAETRKEVLNAAANQEAQQRKQALNNARTHNARQVATNLVKSGWTKEHMNQAQALAQSVMSPEQFADSLSPGFMEILRDAAELRAQKQRAADKLQDKARKAVRVNSQRPQSTTTKKKTVKAGDPDWMKSSFWKGL